ncbi:MAG: EAL domain-containing protein [Acidimicrobiales bacterium]
MRRVRTGIRRLAGRTAAIYLVVGCAWILGSDLFVLLTTDADRGDFVVNSLKGLGFVFFTAAVLLLVLRGWSHRVSEAWDAALGERRRFRALVSGSSDVVLVLADDGVISYASPAVTSVLGWASDEIVGQPIAELLHPDDVHSAFGFWESVRSGSASSDRFRSRFCTSTGRFRHMEMAAADMRAEASVGGIVLNARDVSPRVEAEQRLEDALHYDFVTGLANRGRFLEELHGASRVVRESDSLALLVVDLDRFVEINEEVGRTNGDAVLMEVGRRLGEATDPVALGRIGGDEFGLAVPLDASAGGDLRAEAMRCASRVAEAIAEPLEIGGVRLRLSTSIGVALIGAHGDPDAALAAAEASLHSARTHPERIAVAAEGKHRVGKARASTIVSELRDAIERGELEVHYQPQCALDSGAVVGAEALVRWPHPTRGMLTPGAFLPFAEAHGLQGAITRVCLDDAARRCVEWNGDGHPMKVSVNLSLSDFRRDSIVDEVLAALERHGASAELFGLELTEHTLLAEPDVSLGAMRRLRDAGLHLSIDDFGTGYSSIAHLRMLPVDEMKIDRSFVAAVTKNEVDQAIVSALIGLGHRLGLSIVAEGIEDPVVVQRLRKEGCDVGQGFLFGRPTLPGDFTREAFGRWVPESAASSLN